MAVDAVDVFEKAFEDGLRGRDLRIDQYGAAEIDPRLHQVLRAEVVLRILTHVVPTEG